MINKGVVLSGLFEKPPSSIRRELNQLDNALDQEIPEKHDTNLLVATWNIRSFSSLTRKWNATASDSPKRDFRALAAIINILKRYDVIAIQELKGNLRALRDMMNYLGEDWGFLMTDVTGGRKGNNERLAFLFDRTRVKPSGLAGELVVPPERLQRLGEDALREQFVRTPYAVSFVRKEVTFILVTLHIIFGKHKKDRIPELKEIADIFKDWARRSNRWHHNLLCLGDFNIDRKGSSLFDAFTSTGLTIPADLENQPRTIFDDAGQPCKNSYYDQIAWFTRGKEALIDLQIQRGGIFNFLPYVYTDKKLSKNSISHRVSDHYPLWVEFKLP